MSLHRQFSAFFLVGLATIATHYGTLVALVQLFSVAVVPASLIATPETLPGRLIPDGLSKGVGGRQARLALRKAPPRLGEDNHILEAARKETP